MNVPKRMTDAAATFLDGLDDAQRAGAAASFDDEESRRDWHYVPRKRPGASLSTLSSAQRQLAMRLLSTALDTPAYAVATAIMALEEVLDRMEDHAFGRHHDYYDAIVFGEPGADRWGWRFEGHHLSVNATVVGDDVSVTPSFFGANPAEVGVVRPLAAEHDLGLALASALGDGLQQALLPGDVPDDIVTTNAPVLDGSVEPEGIALADLEPEPAAIARELIGAYVSRVPAELQAATWNDVDRQWGDIRFAWAGPVERRARTYYRLQGPDLLIELDNTAGGDGNHLHTVWRSRANDFGDDLLRRHRSQHH